MEAKKLKVDDWNNIMHDKFLFDIYPWLFHGLISMGVGLGILLKGFLPRVNAWFFLGIGFICMIVLVIKCMRKK